MDSLPFKINGRTGKAVAINGLVSGPILRLRRGQEAVIRVENRLDEPGSIHWHGVLVDIQLSLCDDEAQNATTLQVAEIVHAHLEQFNAIREELLAGRINVY